MITKIIKILFLLTSIYLILGCTEEKSKTAPAPAPAPLSEYIAEYSNPTQDQLQPCIGSKNLLKKIVRCVRRSNSLEVNRALCFSLPVQFLEVPSPSGQRSVNIRGGLYIESCNEGESIPYENTTICNPGFQLVNNTCESFETSGSYMIQRDQFFKIESDLQILFTVGEDLFRKETSTLKLIFFNE